MTIVGSGKYQYICDYCGADYRSNQRADDLGACLSYVPDFLANQGIPCQGTLRRKWSFSTSIPFKEHFNSSAGQHISSRTQHADILKRASEIETLKSGVEHKYVPVDPADAKAVYGIKDDMLESVREDKAKHDISQGQSVSDVQKTKTFVI